MYSHNTTEWEETTDYCSSEYVKNQIVYSSDAERTVSLTVLVTVLVVTLLGQASVIITILKTKHLHIPNFFVILCYCGGDLVMVTCGNILYMYHFVYYCMPLALCRTLSVIGVGTAFGVASLTGLMAFERYMYLCKPLKYEILFKPRFVIMMSMSIYAVTFMYSIATEFTEGRSYHATLLACYLPSSAARSVLQTTLFILPSAVITIFSMIRIWRLMVTCSVAPAQPQGNGNTPAPGPSHQAKKAFKMVGMVSGTFWATILPAMIFHIILFTFSGFTWVDFDRRIYFTEALSLRIITYMYTAVSSLLNPFIYFYSRRDLRQAFCKLLGIFPNSVAPQPPVQVG